VIVSVLILTRDEEVNLPGCLDSLKWCDDVVVFDSFSTDRTLEIAKTSGARVIQHTFDNYGAQRSAALNEVDYKHPWLLMVDADERVSPELSQEIEEMLRDPESGITLYRMRRKDYFMGRWIRHSSGYPTWFGRLMQVGHVRIERTINEEYHTDGKVGFLQTHLIHYPFNKGFSAWLEKHNKYSTMEATLLEKKDRNMHKLSDIWHRDPTVRRKLIKSYVYKLPGRPFIMFLSLYILRGGILEGRAGFIYCALKSFYEFMISCKSEENRLRRLGLPL
jgi:glycosyltransferase involved in cell wall biosynthesis